MAYTNTGTMLLDAHHRGYCIGAFNIVDFTTLTAVIYAADAGRSPIIVQTSPGTVKYYGAALLVAMTRSLAGQVGIPVALHLDHGRDRDLIHDCIAAGFCSVMIDASRYPFDENVRLTRDVVEEAHRCGVAVEGEIGVIAGVEDDLAVSGDSAIYTMPAEALEFQKHSGVDFLAVAIGTAHGMYKEAPRLDIQALRAIRDQADFPLVVHGGTGLAPNVVTSLVASGCSKMNVSTQIKMGFVDSLFDYIGSHRDEYDPLRVLEHVKTCVGAIVSEYLLLFGSAGRAPAMEAGR